MNKMIERLDEVVTMTVFDDSDIAYEFLNAYPKLRAVVLGTQELREAQKAYMLDRGNDDLGKNVAQAAKNVDKVLAALEENVSL